MHLPGQKLLQGPYEEWSCKDHVAGLTVRISTSQGKQERHRQDRARTWSWTAWAGLQEPDSLQHSGQALPLLNPTQTARADQCFPEFLWLSVPPTLRTQLRVSRLRAFLDLPPRSGTLHSPQEPALWPPHHTQLLPTLEQFLKAGTSTKPGSEK